MGRDGALQPRPVLRAIGLGPLPSASASRSAISPTGEEGAESVISRIGHPPIRPVLKAGLLRSVSTGLEKHVAAVTWTGVGFVGWVRNATAGLARGISTQCRTIAASTRIVRGGAIVEKCAWSPRGGHIGVAVVSTSSRACGAGVRTVEVLALPSNVTLELVDNGRSSGEPLAKRSSLDAMTPASSASPASSSFVPSFSSAILSPTAPPINRLAATASPSVLGGAFVEISVGVRGEGAGSIPSDVDRAGAGRRRGWLLAGSRREDGGSGSGTGSGWGRGWKEEVAVDRKDTCESVNDKDGGANGGQGGGDEGRLRQRVGATIRSKFSGNALAGALAGGLVSCCLHPIDTVKTVVQSERGAASSSLFPVEGLEEEGDEEEEEEEEEEEPRGAEEVEMERWDGGRSSCLDPVPGHQPADARCPVGAAEDLPSPLELWRSQFVRSLKASSDIYKSMAEGFGEFTQCVMAE
ncbi:hypothetical protein CBR_g32115 [Chara braunii]|uniref:Uncharacterized protein n=1 Tax=Chara braunii TaxID=69332 RepID=A0A388LGK4_CHABU|nr:hypothetical protein CBR_g32115 [Chara braunii]|eukprot:GBG81438.1 hypothetical protein CBR_g32115 [Chara braunii]